MLKRFLVAVLFVAACSASANVSHAGLVAYWNFNGLSTTGGVPSNAGVTSYAANTGSGSLTLNGWNSRGGATAPHGISNFAGSLINSISPDAAGQSLALQGGTTAINNNGASMTISVSFTNLANPILSFATQRSNTGFTSNQVAYSTDNLNFTNFGATYNPGTSFGLQTFDFSAIDSLDNAANIYLRITMSGATNVSGNSRFDNIQLTAVPEPTSMALFGLVAGAGVVGRRIHKRFRKTKKVLA